MSISLACHLLQIAGAAIPACWRKMVMDGFRPPQDPARIKNG